LCPEIATLIFSKITQCGGGGNLVEILKKNPKLRIEFFTFSGRTHSKKTTHRIIALF